jgi:hypothetical protein
MLILGRGDIHTFFRTYNIDEIFNGKQIKLVMLESTTHNLIIKCN